MAASENGHLEVVKTLIEAGAKVNLTYNVGIHVHICTLFLYSNKCTLYCLKLVYLYLYHGFLQVIISSHVTISLPIAMITVHMHLSN